MASKSIPVTIAFATITIAQLALGMRIVVVAAWEGGELCRWFRKFAFFHSGRAAQAFPPLPFDAYHLCVFVRHRPLEIAYTSISLCYGGC